MKKKLFIPLIAVWLLVCCRLPVFGFDVLLTIHNRENVAKSGEPVTSGIPFAENALTDISRVRLLQNGVEIPGQFRVTARWPNNSIRWLLADFQTNLPALGAAAATLRTGQAPAVVTGVSTDNQAATLTVRTGASVWTFDKTKFLVGGLYFQVVSGGVTYTAVPNTGGWSIEEAGAMKTVVKVEGIWKNGSTAFRNQLVRFRARLFFYRNKSAIRGQLTFQNNNSFGWNYQTPGPIATLSHASFGAHLLSPGGSYVFGQGVECTWDVEIPGAGSASKRESRYNADGSLRTGYQYPYPIAAASPSYYASTNAWGRIVTPLSGFPASLQADFDLFEKLQRAKVIQADVQNPPGLTGMTVWGHMFQDIASWNDYGDLKWGGGYGPLSGNHYDWSYGMLLHFLRTGRLEFFDAARVFARHEIDFDLYHTNENGTAYNYQKHWESRPSHETADNVFGPGRPSHSWLQGNALYWLLTGDPRGYDCYVEMIEGIRQYVYESFNNEGYINTSEIRFSGWLTDTLMVLWRIDPGHVFSTSYGAKTIAQAMKDILKNVIDREAAAGRRGFVYSGDPPDPTQMQPLMNCYFLEPAIKAYLEVFKGRDAAYAAELLGLIRRMTSWLMSVTYGGDSNSSGAYRPRQIPYMVDTNLSQQTDGQIPYIFMAANAAGFCYLETREAAYAAYMRPAFQDYIRYLGVDGGDRYIEDPTLRTPTAYNSNVYTNTESKVHGWSSRYGQYYLAAEAASHSTSLTLTAPNGGENWTVGSSRAITWISSGSVSQVDIVYSTDGGAVYNHVIVSGAPNTGSYAWTVPNTPSALCRVRVSISGNSSVNDASNNFFTISTSGGTAEIVLDRSRLNFGALATGARTPDQQVIINFNPAASLSWSAVTNASWLTASPAAGTGAKTITIGVNPAIAGAGSHEAAVAISATGASAPKTVNVFLNVYASSRKPFGFMETPAHNSIARSSIPVTGWALDDIGVSGVEIWRNPVAGEPAGLKFVGNAVLVEGARPDVALAYPGYPANTRAGWGYMLLTYGLPDRGMGGTYQLYAIVTDREGARQSLEMKTIQCDNATASTPFGAIDTPAQGGTISGSSYVNYGWALTPPPKMIPVNGATVFLYIDGEAKGNVAYNDPRNDVRDLFPGYLNSSGPGGHIYIDSTRYANGLHSMSWTVTDNAGKTDGIGSRFFTVMNEGSGRERGMAVYHASLSLQQRSGAVTVKRGFNISPGEKAPGVNGRHRIRARRMERLQVDLHGPGEYQSAWLSRGRERSRLPVGSSFDVAAGIFYWHIPPGFYGNFELVFAGPHGARIIEINIKD